MQKLHNWIYVTWVNAAAGSPYDFNNLTLIDDRGESVRWGQAQQATVTPHLKILVGSRKFRASAHCTVSCNTKFRMHWFAPIHFQGCCWLILQRCYWLTPQRAAKLYNLAIFYSNLKNDIACQIGDNFYGSFCNLSYFWQYLCISK